MQLLISPRSIGKVNNYFENTQHFQTFFFKDDKFIGNETLGDHSIWRKCLENTSV